MDIHLFIIQIRRGEGGGGGKDQKNQRRTRDEVAGQPGTCRKKHKASICVGYNLAAKLLQVSS